MIISLILGKGHSQSGPIFFLLGFPSVQRELFPIYVESAVPIDNYGTLLKPLIAVFAGADLL